jgi:hypothetical protein
MKGSTIASDDSAAAADVHTVDVLVVGSGPVGAAYARVISQLRPDARILMVERGPRLSARAGANLKNYLPGGALAGTDSSHSATAIPVVAASALARSGTELIDPAGPRDGHMPAAAISTNVGGMGAHWSCATPPPGDDERISSIDDVEWEGLLMIAGELLNSSTSAFGASARGAAMIEALRDEFAGVLDRPVQVMPHACERLPDGRLSWTGSDTVLGPLADNADDASSTFELRSETLCRKVQIVDGVAVGAEIEDLTTGTRSTVSAQAVVVACDSLRTPQLLWSSGVRPPALGRYLNEHAMVGATAVLDDATMGRATEIDPEAAKEDFAADPLAGVWVPYAGATHRFSGQIANSPGSPAGFAIAGLDRVPKSRIVSLTWFCPKDISAADRIEFGEAVDSYGMPVPEIHYELSAKDRAIVDEAIELTTRAGLSFGTFVAGEEPRLLADGQSLHYMGTVRMGETDDGTSVCDSLSRVWGFSGLYVAGNGVIPTATACNPTLTSVAIAVRGARDIAGRLLARSG